MMPLRVGVVVISSFEAVVVISSFEAVVVVSSLVLL